MKALRRSFQNSLVRRAWQRGADPVAGSRRPEHRPKQRHNRDPVRWQEVPTNNEVGARRGIAESKPTTDLYAQVTCQFIVTGETSPWSTPGRSNENGSGAREGSVKRCSAPDLRAASSALRAPATRRPRSGPCHKRPRLRVYPAVQCLVTISRLLPLRPRVAFDDSRALIVPAPLF
jgi:hypothetical protein